MCWDECGVARSELDHRAIEFVAELGAATQQVYDTCHGDVVNGSDIYFGLVKYVSLTAPQLDAGDCLEMRIYGLSVPEGGVTVYNAAYYSGGDPDDH